MVSEVFVSVAYGDVVVMPEPIGALLPVPIGAVPIGLLPFDELGMGYGAEGEPEEAGAEAVPEFPPVLKGADGVAGPVLRGTEGEATPVLRGTDGVASPVLSGTEGEATGTLEVAPIAPFEVPLAAGVDEASRVVVLWWGL